MRIIGFIIKGIALITIKELELLKKDISQFLNNTYYLNSSKQKDEKKESKNNKDNNEKRAQEKKVSASIIDQNNYLNPNSQLDLMYYKDLKGKILETFKQISK